MNAIAMIAACMIHQDPSIPLHYEPSCAHRQPEANRPGQVLPPTGEDVVPGYTPIPSPESCPGYCE